MLKYVQEDSCQRGICGKLVCTDFKIAFLGDDESALDTDVRMSCTWLSLGRQHSVAPVSFSLASLLLHPQHTQTQRTEVLLTTGLLSVLQGLLPVVGPS